MNNTITEANKIFPVIFKSQFDNHRSEKERVHTTFSKLQFLGVDLCRSSLFIKL